MKLHIRPWNLAWIAGVAAFSLYVQSANHVRTVVDLGNGGAAAMWDLNPASLWVAAADGASVSLLMTDVRPVEALAVAHSGQSGPYTLSGSWNYRDWWLLAKTDEANEADAIDVMLVPRMDLRYVRFTAAEPSEWRSVVVGTQEEVESSLRFLRPWDWGDSTDPMVIDRLMEAAFRWQWERVNRAGDNLIWEHGAFHTGIAAAYKRTGDSRYREAIMAIGEDADWRLRRRSGGKGWYHADDHCIGQAWLELYALSPAPNSKWIEDVQFRMDWVMANPLEGRRDYDWCDALFMAPPVYARLASITGDMDYLTFIDGQWWDVSDYLYDEDWQLYYRDSRYFGMREANGLPVFWSRGNGWVLGGLVRMLDHMPQDWPERPRYETQLVEMATRLAAIQDPGDGLWRSSLLYPERFDDEPETSGSAFFVYGIAWAINEGILDREVYAAVVERGWKGLVAMLAPDGELRYIQQIGAEPARNNQRSDRKEYGYGAFLLAATEMSRYFESMHQQEGPPAAKSFTATGHNRGTDRQVSVLVAEHHNSWQKVDTFATDAAWTVTVRTVGTGAYARADKDPFTALGGPAYRLWGGDAVNTLRAYRAIPPIAEGATATIYQRFAVDDSIMDLVFGLSDVGQPREYSDYETGLRFFFESNRLEARVGNRYEEISDDLLQLETWYEVWMVVDNAADTYDVYLRGGSNYRERALLRAGIAFRNGTTDPLTRYLISLNPAQGLQTSRGRAFFADLYFAPGMNLERPAGVAVPRYSPWSDLPRRISDGSKLTALGKLWDDHFPWIHHAALDGWLWAAEHQDANPDVSGWFWSPWAGWLLVFAHADASNGQLVFSWDKGNWWYVPSGFAGWYYCYAESAWRSYP